MQWLLACSLATVVAQGADRALVVTATAGYHHNSIQTAEQVIAAIAQRTRWFDPTFVRTSEEMITELTPATLRDVKLVIFASTTGELPASSRDALLEWIRNGGTFIGIHAAADTWHKSPDYIAMLGAEFDFHPAQELVTIAVNDRTHPATATIDSPHALIEEIYRFKNFSAANVQLLLSISPDLPLAWSKTYGAGRVFYTALGHRNETWSSEWFQQHLTGALAWGLHRQPIPRRRAVRGLPR